MTQEEQTQKCSNTATSGGGGGGFGSITRSSSKKTKQKKVPQRGLGVAQLEKIRLEEQQKKASILSSNPSSLSSSPTKSTSSVPIRHFYHSNHNHNHPPSSIPFPALPPLDLPSPNSIFRPPLIPPQNIDALRKQPISSPTVPLGNNSINNNGHGFDQIKGHGNNNNVPPPHHHHHLWNPCEFNLDHKECGNSGVDPGLAFRSTLNLPFESNNPIWPPLNNLSQRTHQFHHHQPPPPPPPSMVNVSSATSTSPALNFPTEPPSNQSYYSNYTAPMWPDEEKMVGMKRSYPFSLENPAGPSIDFKFPTFVAPMRTTDEATPCGNRSTLNFEPAGNPIFREGPSCSISVSESNSRNSIKENGSVNGDFLTLAPPTTTRTCPSPKLNLPSAYLPFHNRQVPNVESFAYQGNAEGTNFPPAGASGSNPQAAFYSFFPPAKAQNGRAATNINNNCNGEVGETVDLNLKL